MTNSGQDVVHPYVMTVDLSVLESLGINLYSNAAAVLSELVANGYDADATKVSIDWKKAGAASVEIADNGCGMTQAEINERFLKVGYKKRSNEGTTSAKWKRPFMGRKGIGKLSVFSIARTVEVYSTKNGASHGLRIKVKPLEEAINAGRPYYPEPLDVPADKQAQGTIIVLSDLKSKRADLTAAALRKRLARRFDVLDETPEESGGFKVFVNNSQIDYKDRQDLKKLEFIWEFGKRTLAKKTLPKDIGRFVLSNDLVDAGKGWKVRGWIGTARTPSDLTDDDESGSLKNIIVLARKRPIQEGILEKLDFSKLFGNYVTGQIEADFLDLDGGYDDIATSDRQRLIEDDERVVALQDFLRAAFNQAAEQWTEARPKKESKDLLRNYPQLRDWVDGLPGWQQEPARKMLGTVASLALEKNREGTDRALLFRSGIMAFERIGLRQLSTDLEQLGGLHAEDLLPLLGQQEVYEAGLWVDILRSRVDSISQFEDLVNEDEKERVLQEHLFRNLWLLDPSWERATGSEKMEEHLHKIDPGSFPTDADGNEIKGRIDIRYASAGGRHIIVELKRYSVSEDATTFAKQGLKYWTALRKILDDQQRETEQIEVIFVLGKKPRAAGRGGLSEDEYIAQTFSPFFGRYVRYDALIENALKQYQEYLEASKAARKLDELLGRLEKDISDYGSPGDASPANTDHDE